MDSRTILIASHEAHVLNVLSDKFEHGGFEVISAEDGDEALRLARENLPDLIVADYRVPGISGPELCSLLNCDPNTRSIPVIMLTAAGFCASETQSESPNIRCLMYKPFSPREVFARAGQLLSTAVPAGATA